MTEKEVVVVAGLGEVGRPLMYILSRSYNCAGIDIEPVELQDPCSVLHICYPFEIDRFVEVTAEYVKNLNPALTIVHSSVAPGTTREIQDRIGDARLAFSPVRGKHAHMEADMMRYRKFVASHRQESLMDALEHLGGAGFQTAVFPSPEIAELAKMLETTYLGVLIAWTQEMERLAARYDGSFNDVNRFIEEIDFLPSGTFPGVIGGHCVLPNIEILRSRMKSKFLDLVVESNTLKAKSRASAYEGETEDENRTDRIGVLGA